MADRTDFLIVGGGVVGLATALKLQRRFPSATFALLEKEDRLAAHQTGHNSGVIHSGLYYKPGSLKARLCFYGRRQLIEFCEERGVAFEICGKIVVAVSEDEDSRLEGLFERGSKNGLSGLEYLDPLQIRAREPEIAGRRAILVPEEGIVDYVGFCNQMGKLLSASGAFRLLTGHRVESSEAEAGHVKVKTNRGDFEAGFVIFCGGVQADRLAERAGLKPASRVVPFRGEYYAFKPEFSHRVKHLVYPVPDPNFPFLGVHFTRMVGGGVECGPNAVLALHRENYDNPWSVNFSDAWRTGTFPGFWKLAKRHWRAGMGEVHRSLSKAAFVKALQRLMPSIEARHIDYHGSGIRAQLLGRDGSLVDDFDFVRSERQLHVINAPSPAATASLAIGEEIVERAGL